MATSQGAQAFERQFRLFTKTLDERAAADLAKLARESTKKIVAEQTARRGIAPAYIGVVDGQREIPFEKVKATGRIVVLYDYRAEVVYQGLRELAARSPVRSGAYRRSHTVMVDGELMPPMTVPLASRIKYSRRIILVNPLPYSARLEAGVTKAGRWIILQADPRIYESVANVLSNQFRGVATIGYSFMSIPNAYKRRSSWAVRKSRNSRRVRGTNIQYPVITIDRFE